MWLHSAPFAGGARSTLLWTIEVVRAIPILPQLLSARVFTRHRIFLLTESKIVPTVCTLYTCSELRHSGGTNRTSQRQRQRQREREGEKESKRKQPALDLHGAAQVRPFVRFLSALGCSRAEGS